ncbi:Chaoptin [Gryllus bimaculatus]|nr:Chaoptin [Gryllus bimaculatus]
MEGDGVGGLSARCAVGGSAGNYISEVGAESWRGLEGSLQELSLADNLLAALPPDAFAALPQLEALDLGGNALLELDASAFRAGPPRLARLALRHNLLANVPYRQLSPLTALKHLDLSYNRITGLHAPEGPGAQGDEGGAGAGAGVGGAGGDRQRLRWSLDSLRLDHNQIAFLPPNAFEQFEWLNRTSLDGNPITSVQVDAFRDAHVRELSFRGCGLADASAGAFSGLEGSLAWLDLSANNLTRLAAPLLERFGALRTLLLADNRAPGLRALAGPEMGGDPGRASALPGGAGAGGGAGRPGDAKPPPPRSSVFRIDLSGPEMGVVDLQELNRFQNLRSLAVSKLPRDTLSAEDLLNTGVDLEELRITRSNLRTIRSHAFAHARGLRVLDLAENEIATIEAEAFSEVGHSLTSLRLDNGLASSFSSVPADAFRPLANLVELDLSNNRLRSMPEYALLALRRLRKDVHMRLEEVDMGFNQLPEVPSHAFKDLPALERLLLDDNQISRVGWQAFMNLPHLYELRLRGNKLTELPTEGFQNLPALRLLDVSWNALQALDLGSALDAVGTLAPSLVFNASHNNLWRLDSNGTGAPHVSVKVLDLSFNNLSLVSRGALRPVQTSLTRLLLSHNALRNASRAAFGRLPRLQELDLAHNHLQEIDFDAFRDSRRLQMLDLSYNELMDVPAELFRDLPSIRDVRLSHNRLRALPDALFSEDGLRRLDLSHNLLARMPAASLATLAAASVVRLDLQWNAISALHGQDVFSRFKSLQWLDLSGNRLVRLEDAAFAALPRLAHLRLAHNAELQVDARGRAFAGLRDSLLSLSLLRLAGNPVTAVGDTSLLGVAERLTELDLRRLPLAFFEMSMLRTLRVSTYPEVHGLSVPALLHGTHALRTLHVDVPHGSTLTRELRGPLPPGLRNLTLSGPGLTELPEYLLEGVRGPELHLQLRNTSVSAVDGGVFRRAGARLRNLTLDVRNNSATSLASPAPASVEPGAGVGLFLADLHLRGDDWNCDCDLGWVEGWLRHQRQYLGRLAPDDLRLATCSDRSNASLLSVLKEELECGWSSASASPALRCWPSSSRRLCCWWATPPVPPQPRPSRPRRRPFACPAAPAAPPPPPRQAIDLCPRLLPWPPTRLRFRHFA